jgi:hypothetical protein
MQITNFNYNPKLRQFLVDYCLRMYEYNAILDDEHLLMEYKLLLNDNNLNALFLEEYLINYLLDGEDIG